MGPLRYRHRKSDVMWLLVLYLDQLQSSTLLPVVRFASLTPQSHTLTGNLTYVVVGTLFGPVTVQYLATGGAFLLRFTPQSHTLTGNLTYVVVGTLFGPVTVQYLATGGAFCFASLRKATL